MAEPSEAPGAQLGNRALDPSTSVQPATLLSPWWQAVLIGAGAVALAFGTLSLVGMLARPLALLFLAIVIAEALEPSVAWLARRLPRVAAIVLIYLTIVLVVSLIGWLAMPPLIEQAQSVVVRAPELIDQFQSLITRWNQLAGGRLIDAALSQVDRVAQGLASLPLAIISSTAEIALVIVMSIYWLIVTPKLHQFVLSLLPPKPREGADTVLSEIGRNMGGYVRGVIIDAVILGAVAYVGLLVLGVKYHLVLALIAGLGGLIPIVGSAFAGAVMVGVALSQSFAKAFLVLIFYLGLQFLEGNVLLPNIMHRQAYISPFLVIFALFAGGVVGGILGAIVAIPLSAALRVIVVRVIAPAIRQWSGAAEVRGDEDNAE